MKKCGRLKGSTWEENQKDRDIVKDFFESITEDYATEWVTEKHQKRRVPTTWLENLIQNKKTDVEIECFYFISINTIFAMVQRKNDNPWHRVVLLLLQEAEKALVIICTQMGMIHQLLSVVEGIKLMNGLIEGTNLRKEIAEFQEAQSLGRDTFTKGKVGRDWWSGFVQRNGHWIFTKQGK